MPEAAKDNDPQAALHMATETMDTLLTAEFYHEEDLMKTFNHLERAVFETTKTGDMSMAEGLMHLSGYCGRARQCAIENSDNAAAEVFFVAKQDTYREMLEDVGQKPATKAKPTDTSAKAMSGAKSRI